MRVPSSLEGPVGNDGKFTPRFSCLGIPTDIAVILSARKQEIAILRAPRKRQHTSIMASENLMMISIRVSPEPKDNIPSLERLRFSNPTPELQDRYH